MAASAGSASSYFGRSSRMTASLDPLDENSEGSTDGPESAAVAVASYMVRCSSASIPCVACSLVICYPQTDSSAVGPKLTREPELYHRGLRIIHLVRLCPSYVMAKLHFTAYVSSRLLVQHLN